MDPLSREVRQAANCYATLPRGCVGRLPLRLEEDRAAPANVGNSWCSGIAQLGRRKLLTEFCAGGNKTPRRNPEKYDLSGGGQG